MGDSSAGAGSPVAWGKLGVGDKLADLDMMGNLAAREAKQRLACRAHLLVGT